MRGTRLAALAVGAAFAIARVALAERRLPFRKERVDPVHHGDDHDANDGRA